MTISQLRYFIAICDNDTNMTKAAESLHISQSTLSKSINELETELGVLLFNRTNRKIELTSNGIIVMKHSRDVLNRFDELPTLVNQHGRSQLMIGIHPSPMFFMLKLLDDFVSEHPDITVLIEPHDKRRAQLTDAVTNGRLDAAVIVYRPKAYQPDTQALNLLPLKDTDNIYIVNKKHPLAHKKSVTYREIAEYPLYGYIFQARDMFASMGIQPKMTTAVSDPRVMAAMLEHGDGGVITLRDFVRFIPNGVVLELEENSPAKAAAISLRDPAPAKRRAIETFMGYLHDNKDKLRYIFES